MKVNCKDLTTKQQYLPPVIYEESNILQLWEVIIISYCHAYVNILCILGTSFNVKLQHACCKSSY
jgi:hypothetical protein